METPEQKLKEIKYLLEKKVVSEFVDGTPAWLIIMKGEDSCSRCGTRVYKAKELLEILQALQKLVK